MNEKEMVKQLNKKIELKDWRNERFYVFKTWTEILMGVPTSMQTNLGEAKKSCIKTSIHVCEKNPENCEIVYELIDENERSD